MAAHTETFNGHSIEIGDDDTLRIDGKVIQTDLDPVSGTWSTRYLPYTQYDSLLDLGRAVIRDTVEFTDVD